MKRPLFTLGSRVVVNQIAYVVRKKKVWFIPERGNFEVPMVESVDEDKIIAWGKDEGSWLHPLTKDTNKGVIAFPINSVGIIVGLETKMFGHSVSATGGGSLFGDDYDPGYFDARGKIDLYVIRVELRGKSFYAPIDSVRANDDEASR